MGVPTSGDGDEELWEVGTRTSTTESESSFVAQLMVAPDSVTFTAETAVISGEIKSVWTPAPAGMTEEEAVVKLYSWDSATLPAASVDLTI